MASPLHPGLSLRDVIRGRLCPKQSKRHITEYKPLKRSLKYAEKLGWDARKVVALFIVLRGVHRTRVLATFSRRAVRAGDLWAE